MRLDWKAVLGIAVTALLLWFVLRGEDLTEVWQQVRRGDMLLLLAAVAVATSGFLIRALRWKVLLAPLEPDTTLRSRFAAVSIGFMANNVLPARIGEFARAYALSRVEPVSASGAFGTLVVERILDGLTLLGFLLLVVSLPGFPGQDVLGGGPMSTAVDGVVAILGVMILGTVVLMAWPRPFVRIAERIAVRLPGDFARPIVDALEAFLSSLTIFRRPWLLLQAVLWTLGFWLWHGFSFYLGMLAFGIRPENTFRAAIFTESVVGFGVALPSAPGFFGTFHWAAKFALAGVYGVEEARAVAFAFGYHFGGWVPITLIGFWYAWRLGLSFGEVTESEERVEEEVEAHHPVARQLLARSSDLEGLPAVQAPAPVARRVEIAAPAKVNLFLRVLERNPATGYHDLETLFQAIDLEDRLEIEVTGSGMELEVEGMDVGPDRDNLVWRAAAAFAAETALVQGLAIRLTKRIPAGAGLGGGSSDAGATLRALNALFGEPVPPPRLAQLALGLGSDVPFFLAPEPLAFGEGRGERLRAVEPLPEAPVLVAVPPVRMATAEAYRSLDRARGAGGRGTDRTASPASLADGGAPSSWQEVAGLATNDFEAVVAGELEEVAALRRALEATGALLTLLAGSGSAVFALFPDAGAAEDAVERVRRASPETDVHLAATLREWPRPRLVERLGS